MRPWGETVAESHRVMRWNEGHNGIDSSVKDSMVGDWSE